MAVKVCKKCGENNSENATACVACGTSLVGVESIGVSDENKRFSEKKSTPFYFDKTYQSIPNTYANILKITGIATIVVGVILSICLSTTQVESYYYPHREFSLLSFCLYLVIFCASGFFFMGIGEIIQILDNIQNK